MDIRQLTYFLAIAREGQITRAARQLNMEQPPLSRQLKQLEEELGVVLFERHRKRLLLTKAGELLRERAELLLAQLEETKELVRETETGIKGQLSIGAVVSCLSLLPRPIAQFRALYPEVTFKISEGDHYLLGEQLQKRQVELVVARLPFEAELPRDEMEILQLPTDPFVVVLPSSWEAFAGRRQLRLKELAAVPLLTLKTDKTIRMHEQMMAACARHGFEPTIICECSSVAIIMSLVAEGIGATLFPASVLSSFPSPALRMLKLDDPGFQSEVGVLWLRNRLMSKGAKVFLDTFTSI